MWEIMGRIMLSCSLCSSGVRSKRCTKFGLHSLKLTGRPLKNGGWNTTFLLGPGNFSGTMLNFRGVSIIVIMEPPSIVYPSLLPWYTLMGNLHFLGDSLESRGSFLFRFGVNTYVLKRWWCFPFWRKLTTFLLWGWPFNQPFGKVFILGILEVARNKPRIRGTHVFQWVSSKCWETQSETMRC